MNWSPASDTGEGVDAARIAALIHLLGDDDDAVADTIADHLRTIGAPALPALRNVAEGVGSPLRERAGVLVRELLEETLIDDFRAYGQEGCPNLEEGLYLLSRLHTPDLDLGPSTRRLTRMTEDLMVRLDPGDGADVLLSGFGRYLYGEMGYHGNAADYYNPENSYLHTLLISRAGIPISLCTLYLILARRLGLPMTGVGMPGHFLLKYDDGRERRVIDPFHRGRIIDEEGCGQLLRGLGLTFEERYLDAVDNRYILERSLKNLISIYSDRRQQRELALHQRAFEALSGRAPAARDDTPT
ncbi:MAG: transglutaminase-like domain-containing protein [Nitrospirota bacterium]|nr:transglutaminase-like domain-containing protein [Nitrospirota bacterium]